MNEAEPKLYEGDIVHLGAKHNFDNGPVTQIHLYTEFGFYRYTIKGNLGTYHLFEDELERMQ